MRNKCFEPAVPYLDYGVYSLFLCKGRNQLGKLEEKMSGHIDLLMYTCKNPRSVKNDSG